MATHIHELRLHRQGMVEVMPCASAYTLLTLSRSYDVNNSYQIENSIPHISTVVQIVGVEEERRIKFGPW